MSDGISMECQWSMSTYVYIYNYNYIYIYIHMHINIYIYIDDDGLLACPLVSSNMAGWEMSKQKLNRLNRGLRLEKPSNKIQDFPASHD